MNGWWYLHSGEGTASNEVLQSRKGPPPFSPFGALAPPSTSILHSDPSVALADPRAIPTQLQPLQATSRPSGRMSDLTSNPAPIPSLHRRAWTNYIDKRSSIAGQCRNPFDLPASCVRLVSLIFLFYYSNAFPCQVMQSEANCTHPSSSFTRTIPGLLPSPFPPPSTAAEVCAGAELLRHHHSDRFYGPKMGGCRVTTFLL